MRLRITFAKTGALRYTGHLDLHKIWERTARRAALPLAYSQGFHPQPKIALAAALPLGFSSRCEMLDMRLDAEIELEGLPDRIQAAAPPGLKILSVDVAPEGAPALQTQVQSAEYEVTLLDELDKSDLTRRLAAVMEADSLPRERRGKHYDLRPLIETLSLDKQNQIFMRLSARESATGRPDEVLAVLGIPLESTRIERTKIILA